MTVSELIKELGKYDPATPVKVVFGNQVCWENLRAVAIVRRSRRAKGFVGLFDSAAIMTAAGKRPKKKSAT